MTDKSVVPEGGDPWFYCDHEWLDTEDIGNSEYRTCVRCAKCRCPGERSHSDNSVDWPAT